MLWPHVYFYLHCHLSNPPTPPLSPFSFPFLFSLFSTVLAVRRHVTKHREFIQGDAGERLRKRVPAGRFLSLEDLEGPLLLLASDAGAAMTGSVLAVDNGHLVNSL